MTQQQIAAQTGALGADGNLNVYVVAGSVIITPVSASVIFDGTSSAGAFIPCLTFKTQTGAVIARCPAPEVAAGATAEVSWFPGVKTPCPPNGWPNDNQTTTVLAFDPWAYWKLNEANGVTPAVDSSGHGRSLTVRLASVTGGRSGIVPTSSDTSSFVIWNAGTAFAPWVCPAGQTWTPAVGSWEYWLNSPGHSPNEMTLGVHGTIGGPGSFLFFHRLNSAGQPFISFQDTGGAQHVITSPIGVVDNSTHQLVWVLDGTNVTVYLDGAQADQQAQPAAMKNPFTAAPSLGMALGGAGSRFYTGFLEHVAWYDKVLSAANVLSLYQAGTEI